MPDLDRRITAWLDDRAIPRAPDDLLDETLVRTSRLRRRPAWRIPERWIPVPITLRLVVVPRAVIYALLLALLVAMLAAGGLVVGSLRYAATVLAPPNGPAQNGLIAFDGDGDIWVVEPDGSGRRQLTSGPALEHGPAWSRDGTRIAYWSQDEQGGPSSLVVADADGSDPVTVASDDAGRTSLQFLDWSPDGRSVTYSLGSVTDPYTLDQRVYVAATDGSTGGIQVGPADLTAHQPSWSPDGSQVVFTGSTVPGSTQETFYADQGIYLMAPDGSGLHRLSTVDAPAQYEFYRAEWSPDGRRIASTVGGRVWGFEQDGSQEGPITPVVDGAIVSRWSPDGTTILYASLDTSHLLTVPASGGASTDLGDPGSGHIWSPDGTQVATFHPGELALLDATTGDVVHRVAIGDQSYPDTFHYPSWQRLAP